jgi:hypothetical protein
MLLWEPKWADNDGAGAWWLLLIALVFILAEIAHAAVNYPQWKWMVE